MLLWAWRGRLFYKYLQTCFPHFVFVSVFNAHRKSVNCSVIRRATETGAHRFLLPVFHLPSLHHYGGVWWGAAWFAISSGFFPRHSPPVFLLYAYGNILRIFDDCRFFVTISPKWQCKGSAFICFLQAFSKINAYLLTFIITIMLIYAIL